MANERTTCVTVAGMAPSRILTIGRQMENNYRTIVFDCSGFDVEVSSVQLVHQRPGDSGPYPAAESNSDVLAWTVSNTDTAYAGYGTGELRITFTDGLAKSVTFTTLTIQSITADVEIPEPLQSWYDALIEYIDEHGASQEAIEEAVAAYLDEHPIQFPVTSVNGETGAVILTAADVGALADSVTIPEKTSDLVNDSGFITTAVTSFNGLTGAVTYSAPVASVNSKTGTVVLTASDVGALPSTVTVPTRTSELQNDSGFITGVPAEYVTETELATELSGYAETADLATVATSGAYADLTGKPTIPTAVSQLTNDSGYITSAPVASVNGQTGTVVLDADDVGALPDTYTAPVTSVNTKTGAVTLTASDVGALPDSAALKQAMMQIATKVVYSDEHGADYVADLYEALYSTDDLISISAAYTQTDTVYVSDPLTVLEKDLVVTATYTGGITSEVPAGVYTLSGALSEGTSTVTASYGGKSATFTVTVSADPVMLESISAAYTQGGFVYDITSLDSLKNDLVVTATYSDSSAETVPATDYTLAGSLTAGTSTITVTYENKTTTFNVTVTAWDYYHYSLTNGQIILRNGSVAVYNSEGIETDITNNNRRCFLTKLAAPRAVQEKSLNWAYIDLYPIPIPSDATKITVSITPSSQFHGESMYSYNSGTNKYTRNLDPGWKQGSFTHTVTAGQNQYMTVAAKYNSAGSSYPTDPTELEITFATS